MAGVPMALASSAVKTVRNAVRSSIGSMRDARVRAGWPALAHAASEISTPLLQNMGTVGGNLLLDTRCNYYDQGFEWRKAINFCMKKDGDTCWVAPSSPRCWAVQSSDLAPVVVALDAQVVLAGAEAVNAYDPASGEQIWTCGGFKVPHPYGRTIAGPTVADGLVVVVDVIQPMGKDHIDLAFLDDTQDLDIELVGEL